jgi:transposase
MANEHAKAVLRDRDQLKRLYHGRSIAKVADELGVHQRAVHYWLKKHRIARRRPGGHPSTGYAAERLADRLWLFRAYVRERRTCEDIAIELDCHHQTVLNALVRHGIDVRPAGNPVPPKVRALLDDPAWLVGQLHERGRTYRQVADDLGVSVRTVVKAMAAGGVPTRRATQDLPELTRRRLDDPVWIARRVHHDNCTYRQVAEEVGVSPRTITRALDRHGIPRRQGTGAGSRPAVLDVADEAA